MMTDSLHRIANIRHRPRLVISFMITDYSYIEQTQSHDDRLTLRRIANIRYRPRLFTSCMITDFSYIEQTQSHDDRLPT